VCAYIHICTQKMKSAYHFCTHWQQKLLGRGAVRPLFVPNGQAQLLALPLVCFQIDFSSISYWIGSCACILKPVQNSTFSQLCHKILGVAFPPSQWPLNRGFAPGPHWGNGLHVKFAIFRENFQGSQAFLSWKLTLNHNTNPNAEP